MTRILTPLVSLLLFAPLTALHATEPPLNVLLITADDIGYEAMDFLDGKVPGVTPNLSKLASESLSFPTWFCERRDLRSEPQHYRHGTLWA
jgi:hypothetical protein